MTFRVTIAALAFAALPLTAGAQDLTYNLTGTVETVCGAYSFAADDNGAQDKSFGTLSDVGTSVVVTAQGGGGSITYICNAPGGFTRTVTSDNSGFLFREGTSGGGANQLAYTVQHGGGSGLNFSERQLTAPEVRSFNASQAFLNGQTGSITFRTTGVRVEGLSNEGVGTTVFAGTYTDVVTVGITAN